MAVGTAASSSSFKVTTPSDCEITLTRLFAAPRPLVLALMSKPEHVKRWWGALDDKHSMPVCEIDFRVGGAWHFVGQGPKGKYGFHGEYREIVPPERVIFTEIYDPFPDDGSLVTSVLTEEGGKTRLTVTARYRT